VTRRPEGEPHVHVQGETPEMAAVFAEVKDAIEDAIAEGKGPASDSEYMAASCIGIAREVCDKMLMRRPIDTTAAAEFAIAMIIGGVRGLPGARR
jgi:hypothetical protein